LGPNLFRLGFPGTAYFNPSQASSDWGFDFYGGVVGRLMAINVFIDGNTFQDNRHVDKEVHVGDI
jgi:lipid A 3-O-deacylase